MSWSMRILLLLGSVMTAVYVLRKVRKSKMRTEASVFWLLFSVVLVLLGLFPEIAIGVSVCPNGLAYRVRRIWSILL